MQRAAGLVLALLILWPMSAPVLGQSQSDESALELRVKHFTSAINAGDPDRIKQLVDQDLAASLQKLPLAAHIGLQMTMWHMSRGLDLHELQEVGPYEATALFKNRLTGGWNALWFKLESQPPHRIVAIGPRKPNPPESIPRRLSDKQIARELETFMQRLARVDAFSGAVALGKNGAVVFQGAYGQADRDTGVAATPDTKYHLASMSKMFTAVAIGQLVERGQLSFDDSLSKFIPQFPNEEAAKKIQIKHLLSHSAGLGMWWGPRYQESAKDFRSVDEMLAWAAEDEKATQFEPGSQFKYSNTGFVVLGKVIEIVTGQSYYDYVREHIFKPAGMDDTDSFARDAARAKLATGYARTFDEGGAPSFRSNTAMLGARGGPHGGGYSTATNLLKFSDALRSGKLLKRENVAILLSAKPELGATEYGYGFDVDETRGTAGHGGGSHGISNNFEMFLDSGWTAIVLSNYTMPGIEASAPVVQKIQELVGDARP
jgi:CubicO group peptidase (beta-lactamase class C family)